MKSKKNNFAKRFVAAMLSGLMVFSSALISVEANTAELKKNDILNIENEYSDTLLSIKADGETYSSVSQKDGSASAPESSSNRKTETIIGRELIESANNESVTDYNYKITPILEPFNEYFFVETDNPDPTSFRFADKSSVYSEESTIVFNYDSWYDEVKLYSDIEYENEETGRVNGGYIFKSFNTDGGEIVLQSKDDAYYEFDVTWSDTNIKLELPVLKDDVDYLIDTYATESSFFDNMDAVQSGFSSICLYSGSFIRGQLTKPNDYWCVAVAGHIDQSFYIYSPYDREDSKSLFATAIYPFRYDSLGFPSVMGAVSKRLDNSSSYEWNSNAHYLIDVTYGGETRSYGGQGSGEGQGISEDKIKQYFTFGTGGTKITLPIIRKLLEDYAGIEMDDDIPREDELTWKKIYDKVGEGSWVRILGSNWKVDGKFQLDSPNYAYFYQKGDGTYFADDEWGVGYSNYWGGDLGYAQDVWVDGRYIGEWRRLVPGEKFEDHPTSDIILNQVNVPQITYDYTYQYNSATDKYDKVYSDVNITENTKNVLFNYDEGIWKANYNAFDDGCANYNDIVNLVEKGLIDDKYLDMVTLTLEEVQELKVDENTNDLPMNGFVYDGTEEPGTPYEYENIDSDTDSNTDTDTETSTDTATDTDSETDTDTSTDSDTETDIDTGSDTDTETSTDTDTDTETDTDTSTDSDTETDTDTATDSDTETDTDTSTDGETETDTDTSTDGDTETDTDTSTDSDTETDTSTDTDTDTDVLTYKKGDISGDGSITASDALTTLRAAVGAKVFTDKEILIADVNSDGKITSSDALLILRYAVGFTSNSDIGREFPINS